MANDSVEGCTCDAERRLITAVEVEPTEVAGGLLDAQYPPENGIWTVVVSSPLNIHDLVAGIGAYVFERQIHTALDDKVADLDADRDDPLLILEGQRSDVGRSGLRRLIERAENSERLVNFAHDIKFLDTALVTRRLDAKQQRASGPGGSTAFRGVAAPNDRLPTIRRSSTQERAANRGRRGPDSC